MLPRPSPGLGSDPSSRRAQDVRQEDPRSPSGLISRMSPAAVTQTPSAPCGTPSGGAGGGCHDTSHCGPPTRIRACSPSAATGYAPHPSPLGAGRARSLTIVIRSAFPVSRSPQPRDLRRKTAGTSPASVLGDHPLPTLGSLRHQCPGGGRGAPISNGRIGLGPPRFTWRGG